MVHDRLFVSMENAVEVWLRAAEETKKKQRNHSQNEKINSPSDTALRAGSTGSRRRETVQNVSTDFPAAKLGNPEQIATFNESLNVDGDFKLLRNKRCAHDKAWISTYQSMQKTNVSEFMPKLNHETVASDGQEISLSRRATPLASAPLSELFIDYSTLSLNGVIGGHQRFLGLVGWSQIEAFSWFIRGLFPANARSYLAKKGVKKLIEIVERRRTNAPIELAHNIRFLFC